MTTKFDMTAINDKVLSMMETYGTGWMKPWVDIYGGAMPCNAESKRQYTGFNPFILMSTPFTSRYWGNFNCWKRLGAHVKSGEKSTSVLFWKIINGKDEDGNPKTIPLMRTIALFNAQQVEGWTEPASTVTLYATQGSQLVDDLLTRHQVIIDYGGNKAAYIPSSDRIICPPAEAFKTEDGYDSTRLHELAHWTGHTSRLDRLDKHTSAEEELVAELASLYMCMTLGVSKEIQPDHAQYLQAWKERIKDDEWSFYKTSKLATKVTEYLLAEKEEEQNDI